MSVNEEFQKPKCLSALRAPPVAERFGASISGSHRHFDRCIFSFADISAASSPRGGAPGGLPGLSWVLPGASRAPPGNAPAPGTPWSAPRTSQGPPGSGAPKAPGRFPRASRGLPELPGVSRGLPKSHPGFSGAPKFLPSAFRGSPGLLGGSRYLPSASRGRPPCAGRNLCECEI